MPFAEPRADVAAALPSVAIARTPAGRRMTEFAGAEALAALLQALADRAYRFVPPTPETHRRVLSRAPKARAKDLRDVFGWSLPFSEETLDPEIVARMAAAGVLRGRGPRLRSAVRVASLADDLFLHSAFPPDDDAVFFGPDTYRFVDFLKRELADGWRAQRVLDFGAGSGAGGIAVARVCAPQRLVLADVNPAALRLSAGSARFAGVAAEVRLWSDLSDIDEPFDLVIANPPFIAEGGHTYRDGAGMHGGQRSLEWIEAGSQRLAEDGRMLVYTGAAICAGRDALREALEERFAGGDFELSYREIDPDVFGEELTRPVYREVERIAAVGVSLRRVRRVSEQRQAIAGAKAFLGAVIAGATPS